MDGRMVEGGIKLNCAVGNAPAVAILIKGQVYYIVY